MSNEGPVVALTDGERRQCLEIAGRIVELRDFLVQVRLGPPENPALWLLLLQTMKSTMGNFSNCMHFLAILLAKQVLIERLNIPPFDASLKAQGAKGHDIVLVTRDGQRVVAEVKTGDPASGSRFGAEQRKQFRADLAKLSAAGAQYKFFFLVEERAWQIVHERFAAEFPDVEVVLLPGYRQKKS